MKKSIETSNLVLAASLKCLGYELVKIDKNASKGTFCFKDVDDEDLIKFDIGQLRIEPLAFSNTQKMLVTAARRY